MNHSIIAQECVCCGSNDLAKMPAVLMPFVAHRALGWESVEIDTTWGLQTIPSGKAYSLCNSLLCNKCGLLFLDIRFDDAALGRLYEHYRGDDYTQLREKYEPGYVVRNRELQKGFNYVGTVEKFLESFVSLPITVLDWGGDTGINTPFKTEDNTIHIYDISNVPVCDDCSQVNLEQAKLTHYDLIVCSNVLEHTPYPQDVLLSIREIMDNETKLFIEIPHEVLTIQYPGKLERLKHKKHWHEHINFYTEESIRLLIEACRLELLDIQDIKIEQSEKAFNSCFHAFMAVCRLPHQ